MSFTVLHVNSSPLGDRSVSRKLTAKILTELKHKHPDAIIVNRDLVATPIPHLDSVMIGAFFTPPDQRNEAANDALALSDSLISELFAADAIVIGAPMWNFGIPSSLKAWIDHVVRAGRTFQYSAAGAAGLLPAGKHLIIASSRGAVFSIGPMQAMDHQEAYLKSVLAFIGLTDVSIIRAEGVGMGEEALNTAMESAEHQLVETMQQIA